MCNFPALLLISEMRKIAREADKTNDPARILYAAAYVKATNDLRLAHEDLSECQCWYDALKLHDEAERVSQALSEVA